MKSSAIQRIKFRKDMYDTLSYMLQPKPFRKRRFHRQKTRNGNDCLGRAINASVGFEMIKNMEHLAKLIGLNVGVGSEKIKYTAICNNGIKPFGMGPMVMVETTKNYRIMELRLRDIIPRQIIEDIADGSVDIQKVLSEYGTMNLILLYQFLDLENGLKVVNHATNVKFIFE